MALEKTIRIYSCDMCEKRGKWNDNWRSKMIPHKGPIPYDQTITVCSDGCALAFDTLPRKIQNRMGTR